MPWKHIEGIESPINSDGGIMSLLKRGYGSLQLVTNRTDYIRMMGQARRSRFPHNAPIEPRPPSSHNPPRRASNQAAALVMNVVLASLFFLLFYPTLMITF